MVKNMLEKAVLWSGVLLIHWREKFSHVKFGDEINRLDGTLRWMADVVIPPRLEREDKEPEGLRVFICPYCEYERHLVEMVGPDTGCEPVPMLCLVDLTYFLLMVEDHLTKKWHETPYAEKLVAIGKEAGTLGVVVAARSDEEVRAREEETRKANTERLAEAERMEARAADERQRVEETRREEAARRAAEESKEVHSDMERNELEMVTRKRSSSK